MAQRSNEKRTRILKASYDYFSRMTYDEVSLSSIAEASGINKPLLQHCYGRKSDIIRTLLDEIFSSSVSFMKTMKYSGGGLSINSDGVLLSNRAFPYK